jgi:hypothetical protein
MSIGTHFEARQPDADILMTDDRLHQLILALLMRFRSADRSAIAKKKAEFRFTEQYKKKKKRTITHHSHCPIQ